MTPRSIRLKIDHTLRPDYAPSEQTFWRGSVVNVDLGIYEGDVILSDLTNLTSITFRVREDKKSTTNLISKTVAAASFGSPTDTTWSGGTAQHARFTLSSSETNLATNDDPSGRRSLHYSISALRTDGETLAIGAGSIIMLDDNDSSGSDPEENPDNAMSPTQGDARYVKYSASQSLTNAQASQALANMKVTISAGGYLRLVDSSGNVFNSTLNSGEPPS